MYLIVLTSDSTFTAPWAGVYRFALGGGLQYTVAPASSDYRISASFHSSSDTVFYNVLGWLGTTVGNICFITGSVLKTLKAGDVVQVYMYTSQPIILGPYSDSRFYWQGEYLGKF